MIVFPNAKINIGLNVVSKRSDGYHSLESIFYPIPLKDVLEAIPQEKQSISFGISGIKIPDDGKDNLIMRAFKLMAENHGLSGAEIHLIKNIPTGAGLGGGSADAAFTVRLANDLFNLSLSEGQMESYAQELGSDCPFFIKNRPAFVSGRGEIIEPIELDLSGYYLFLIHPGIHIPTAGAYKLVTPQPAQRNLKEIVERESINSWKDLIVNDFEKSVFRAYPEIEELKNKIYENGAIFASMTGSGSAVYGLYKDRPSIDGLPVDYYTYISLL